MPQTDLNLSPPRPRTPPAEVPKRYRCTNCGLINEPSAAAPAACRECGHTGFSGA